MRLSRYLARCGVASRRAAEHLIDARRVTVNGSVVSAQGVKVDEDADEICVDGTRVMPPAKHLTIMLNKPAGFLTTMDDPQGRHTVAELIPRAEHPSLFPIGRLDYDTTGLLLFTTDGDLGYELAHPSHDVPKRYRARVKGTIGSSELERLQTGIMLDNRMTAPAHVEMLSSDREPLLAVTIHEGRNRQVRRMFEAIGCQVLELHRESIGELELGSLETGAWRALSDSEIELLRS